MPNENDNGGKVHQLHPPGGAPARMPCTTSLQLQQLPGGERIGRIFLIVTTPQGPVVLGHIEAHFQLAEHLRILQAGLSGIINQLPPDIIRPA